MSSQTILIGIAGCHGWSLYNYSGNEAFQNTPFYVNSGQQPLLPASLNKPQKVPEAHTFVEDIKKAEQGAQRCLDAARQRMRAHVDQHRRDISFNAGDLVLLSTRSIRSSGSEKLLPKWMGDFRVGDMDLLLFACSYHLNGHAFTMSSMFIWSSNVCLESSGQMALASCHVMITPPPPVAWHEGEPLYE
eukprot:85475-Pelagomonas_calceolata.AAC.1